MNTKYTRFALAAVVYTAFAVYLYRPYFKGFAALRLQDLIVANACLASLGCYVLSRRWMAGFAESVFAGAIYGFGPFALGLLKFHPTVGFLVAAIPWLFCPAVFGPKVKRQKSEVSPRDSLRRSQTSKFRLPSSVFCLLSSVLCLLPFLAIVLFFQVSARFGLYPIPIKLKLHGADLASLLAPLVAAKSNKILVGFYHVPIASLIMGFSMFLVPLKGLSKGGILQRGRFLKGLAVRRFGIVAIFAVATILAFCDSFGQISPIIWLAISTLCCSVLIGVGMQGLISAGPADRKWILLTAIILGVFAIVTLYLVARVTGHGSRVTGYARLLTETAKMYILGAVTMAMLFVIGAPRDTIGGAKLWIHPVRQILLCATMALDIFLGARFIVDTIL
jgi:hypothetical protein